MTTTYSPSKINTFNSCRLKYKYSYIDRLESEIQNIETFRGSMVHEALESFYKLIKGGSVKPLDWLLAEYENFWNKNYLDSIRIVKKELTKEDYFKKGKQCLIDYYNKYTPFNQAKVVDTESKVFFDIRHNGTQYKLQGILDRLDWNDKENIFEIHDYKVTSRLMTQQEADSDWQLGLYHIALKKKWPDIKEVKLIWHSLLFNAEITSKRTEMQIEELKKRVTEKIKQIESCKDFPSQKSSLCPWCEFQEVCPLWKHPIKTEQLALNEYKNDPGVTLVAKFTELESQKSDLKNQIAYIAEEQEKIKEAAVEYAEKEGISVIDGPIAQLKIDTKDEIKAPTRAENPQKWQDLRDFLIQEGKYQDVSTVNANMLKHRIKNKIWPLDFIEKIKIYLTQTITKTVRLIKK